MASPTASSSASASASDSDDYFFEDGAEDLSFSDLDSFPDFLLERAEEFRSLLLNNNQISILPRCIGTFRNLITLDLSNNGMNYLSKEIVHLKNLKTLTAKNNLFKNEHLPKELAELSSLQVVNFSGNQLTDFPMQFANLLQLRCLYLGGNHISEVPNEIINLKRLEILYLGGNKLQSMPEEVGYLSKLNSLVLCDNQLSSLPSSLVRLRSLQSLSLHNNRLSTLPPGIVKLNLIELSLRNNPLIVKFVEDMVYEPPTLLELAGRVVKAKKLSYSPAEVPMNLVHYLDSAHSCVNPKCRGVYFTSRVEHIKFVDFCGKYRLPLMEYLCSPTCAETPVVAISESESEEEPVHVEYKMKKVLLG